jgi:serine/threonine protein kinase
VTSGTSDTPLRNNAPSAPREANAAPKGEHEAGVPPGKTTVIHGESSDAAFAAGSGHAEAYQPGDMLAGRYQIQTRLGRGGFGAVYSAIDRALNRIVAIKQSTGLKSFVAGRVRDEARAVASLNHRNIVQIFDLIQVKPNEQIIVMECLEGVSLAERLRNSRISINDAVKIGVEILEALIHAHEKQLVHSDLKPANLFLCHSGVVKLLDFGLAVAYFPERSQQRIGGTLGYMSPEQMRGESHLIDGRTDLWAFGIVMYEMLTGSHPFASQQELKHSRSHLLSRSAPPPRQLNPAIDNELQRIILKCLEPLIKSRYASASEVRDDLVHWLRAQGQNTTSLSPEVHSQTQHEQSAAPASWRIALRGLQPFAEQDGAEYLSLIPGPRDRFGIPDSIRFWKRVDRKQRSRDGLSGGRSLWPQRFRQDLLYSGWTFSAVGIGYLSCLCRMPAGRSGRASDSGYRISAESQVRSIVTARSFIAPAKRGIIRPRLPQAADRPRPVRVLGASCNIGGTAESGGSS